MRGQHVPFQLLDTDDLSFLTEEQQRLFTLATYSGEIEMTYAKIAEDLGINIGTVKSRLSRLRAKIVKRRQPVEVDIVENASLLP